MYQQEIEQETGGQEDDRPPVFRTWNQVYAFVLVLHAIIIMLFYLFTQAYA